MQPDPINLTFDLAVIRLDAIKKAAYRFGDRCHVGISATGAQRVQVSLTPKRVIDNPSYLAGEFKNEVLDQELRESVAAETRPIRDALLKQAFSAVSLLNPTGDTANFRQDPLGISKPDSDSR